MDPAHWQGRALARSLEALRALIADGEAPAVPMRALDAAGTADGRMNSPLQTGTGLWTEADAVAVATPELVALGDRLPHPAELPAAVVSRLPEVRAAWRRVVLGRLSEMGERGDVAALSEAVTAAGALAAELVDDVAPSLAPTPFGELERAVLPAAAHEAPAFPVLLRCLAATAEPVSNPTAPPLPAIAWDDPSSLWRPGRLLRLPQPTDAAQATVVLPGGLDGGAESEAMRWALRCPWAFLLAQLVFTQEAWAAERVSGGLAFELEAAHVALLQHPPRVETVVTLPSGEEIRCGSLGEFVQKILAQLAVTILAHRLTLAALDEALPLVIEALIHREVWRFEHGSGARRPGYRIHPAFSDACYRALGSRAFYRLGSPVTAAIRRVAETWARDRIARAGSSGEGSS